MIESFIPYYNYILIVTTSKALVTSSDALVSNSFLFWRGRSPYEILGVRCSAARPSPDARGSGLRTGLFSYFGVVDMGINVYSISYR